MRRDVRCAQAARRALSAVAMAPVALLVALLAPQVAYADVAGGPGLIVLGLGALVIAVVVMVFAVVALVLIIRYLRADRRDRRQRDGRPVRPDDQ